MIKVMVLFYGLVMFVPQEEVNGGKRTEKLTVLFVHGGAHTHDPKVYSVGSDGSLSELLEIEDGFRIVISGPAGTVGLDARDKFVDLEDLFSNGRQSRIRTDCMEDEWTCSRGGDDLVRGRVQVQGGWETRPATYCNRGWSQPVKFYPEAKFQFRRSVTGRPHDDFDVRPLATALRLDTEISCGNTEECEPLEKLVKLGNEKVDLEPIANGPCERWIGGDIEKCVILVIGNEPPLGPRPNGFQLLDKHFDAFYRVTVNPPWQRWLPYIYDHPCCPEGFGPRLAKETLPAYEEMLNMPAPLCPPAWATPEP